jgi:hypothetical protein
MEVVVQPPAGAATRALRLVELEAPPEPRHSVVVVKVA